MNIRRCQIWKRFVSALLVFCLTCGLVWTNGGILAMASTELPSENLGAAKSEGTIVGWVSSAGSGENGAGASPGTTLRFDLHGLINAADNQYVKDYTSQIITTYMTVSYTHLGVRRIITIENKANYESMEYSGDTLYLSLIHI